MLQSDAMAEDRANIANEQDAKYYSDVFPRFKVLVEAGQLRGHPHLCAPDKGVGDYCREIGNFWYKQLLALSCLSDRQEANQNEEKLVPSCHPYRINSEL